MSEPLSESRVPALSEPALPADAASPESRAPALLTCANCQAPLTGEYCARCGQRHEPHVHSVTHFAGEAFESISHADSRLWRTLFYLLFRPGYLTREFFDGHRVRYLPPFRLYLVISVLFFLAAGAFAPDLNEAKVEVVTERTADDKVALNLMADEIESTEGAFAETRKKIADQLREEAKLAPPGNAVPPGNTVAPGSAAGADDTKVITPVDGMKTGIEQFCAEFDPKTAAGDERREGILRWCRRYEQGGIGAIGTALAHNIPRAMFVFLPLLALCMKLLYWRPKRYYVEHLLFMIHNHAFVFLAAMIAMALMAPPFVGDYAYLIGWIVFFYMAWYIYRAMRRVYGQGRARTLAKYFTLAFTYFIAGFSIFVMTLVYSAMTF